MPGAITSESATTTYAYDTISRLSSVQQAFNGGAGNLTEGLAYDAASEITSRTCSNTGFSFNGYASLNRAYAANALNQYVTAGAATFSYDANGNLTGDGTNTYGYDAENRLISASTSGGATLRYDPLGRLFQTSSATYGTTQYLYDGQHVIAEYSGSGTLLRRFFWGPGADEPVMQDEGGQLNCTGTRFLQHDELGSVVGVADCSGNLQVANTYDEYGIPGSGAWGRYQYTGQAWIPDLGMSYYKARFYSPTLGRFMQTDPIGYKNGPNWYAYVHNDPINGTDPSGTEAIGAVVGAIYGGINGAIVAASSTTPNDPSAGWSVAAGAVAGALTGFVAGGVTDNLGIVGGVSSAAADLATQALSGQPLKPGEVVANYSVGSTLSLIGGSAVKGIGLAAKLGPNLAKASLVANASIRTTVQSVLLPANILGGIGASNIDSWLMSQSGSQSGSPRPTVSIGPSTVSLPNGSIEVFPADSDFYAGGGVPDFTTDVPY